MKRGVFLLVSALTVLCGCDLLKKATDAARETAGAVAPAARSGSWEGIWEDAGRPGNVVRVSRAGAAYLVEDREGKYAAAVRDGQLVISTPLRDIAAVYVPSDDALVFAGRTFKRVASGDPAQQQALASTLAANESAAIGDLRTVISGQAAYQSSNGGWYEGNPSCLGEPWKCIPGYARNSPSFLDADLASVRTRNGYRRRFVAGAPAQGLNPGASSASSSSAYAYLATPVERGKTGLRSFCGDSSGVICFRVDGKEIAARDGGCPVSADPEGEGCLVLQ